MNVMHLIGAVLLVIFGVWLGGKYPGMLAKASGGVVS